MPKHFLLTACFFTCCFLQAQVISKFTWDSNPVTTAITGPNAISAGSSATSSPGGVGGTNGLNPGNPNTDINMHIPNTGNVFDINNIDISIDYRRNESTAQMIKRGNTFTFNVGGAIGTFKMAYRISDGAGGFATVTSTAVNIPQDNTFRNYRFTYDNCSGVGTMYVNNSVVWSTPTPTANRNLYWVSDGDIVIGQDMDGASNNIPNLDNFILQPYTCSVLPIELISFTGIAEGEKNLLQWATATEKDNDFFTVERSNDGESWSVVSRVEGAGNANTRRSYSTYDAQPPGMLNYYRLVQTDTDGHSKKFTIITIDNSGNNSLRILKTVDVLGRDVNNDYQGPRFIYYSNGSVVKQLGQ